MMKNHYELLAVANTATKDEIKKAYLKMMKQYHPDVFKGKQSLSQEYSSKLNAAYNVLKDSEKRLAYDKTIFPKVYTQNYVYDNLGNRMPVVLNHGAEELPAFSFLQKSKLSENLGYYLSLSRKEKKKLRKDKNMEKKLMKKDKLQSSKQKKLDRKKQQNNLKQQKKELIVLQKKNSANNRAKNSKRKLEISIVVVLGLLLIIFGVLIYLNIAYKV